MGETVHLPDALEDLRSVTTLSGVSLQIRLTNFSYFLVDLHRLLFDQSHQNAVNVNMEFVSELFQRLEDEDRPIPKRMKLAQNAYYATGGSSERIVAWISSRLKNISNDDFNEFSTIWKKLATSGHSQHISHLVKLMLEVVNKRLADYDRCVKENVLRFLVNVLENTRVQNYFVSDLDSYIALLQTVLLVLATGSNKDENLCRKLFETMEAFARLITRREYPLLFLDKLLLPCVALVNSFEPHSVTLEKHLLSLIEMAIFFRSTPLVASYLDALLTSKKKKAELATKKQSVKDDDLKSLGHLKMGYKLLEKLSFALNNSSKDDVLLLYSAIIKCLAKTNKANMLSFKMLIVIYTLVGINVDNAKLKVILPEELKKNCLASPSEQSFEILDLVLAVVLKEKLMFPDEGLLPFVNFIECLWRVLLAVPLKVRRSSAYVRCLTSHLDLYPRVVMNRNLSIISDVLISLTPESEVPEFVPFLRTLMSIHQKRFSLQELLVKLFTSSKQLLNSRKKLNVETLKVNALVPSSVYGDIQRYASDWTSTPVLDFIDFILPQLTTLVFSSESRRSVHMDTSMAVAVKLLCGVLTGARIVEHCGNEKIRLAYISRFDSLSQLLKQMGTVSQTTDNEDFLRSFLDLEITWSEVALMLLHYCPEASATINDFARQPEKKKSKKENHSAIINALAYVHAHISPADWEVIQTKMTNSHHLCVQQLMVCLEVQTLRYFIVSHSMSRAEVGAISKEVLPHLARSMDVESMMNDIYSIGKFLEGDELKQLVEKLVEVLLSSNIGGGQHMYTKILSRFNENKSVTCGMVLNLLERLNNICSSSEMTENRWTASHKILCKLSSSDVNLTCNFVGEEWDEMLISLGKTLNKSLKKSHGSETTKLADPQMVKQILTILDLLPLEYLPESVLCAVIIVMFGLSVDLFHSEDSEEKSTLVEFIYREIVFGVLERWPITSEVPSLQKYLNIAAVVSHIRDITQFQNNRENAIVHALLGTSLRSETSLNKVLRLFFSDDDIPEDIHAVQQEMLFVICKDVRSVECREVLKSSDCETRVVSSLVKVIQTQRSNKTFLPTYTVLLGRSLRKKDNVDELLPKLGAYCKISLKCLRNDKEKRLMGEEFVREVLKFHELQEHIPQDFVLDLWAALLEIDEPNVDIASHLFAGANKDDFEKMIDRIMEELPGTSNSSTSRTNVLAMWEALVKSPLVSEQHLEKRSNALSFFLAQQHVFLSYPAGHLLKVLLGIVEYSKIVMPVYIADHIFQAVSSVMSRRNRSDVISLVPSWFALLNGMLFHRASQTLDCLPAFTAELRLLIQTLVTCSRNSEHLELCVSVFQGIEKMFQTIVKAKMTRNFSRIGAYILADLLKHFEEQLPRDIKLVLENIACDLLGFLDMYAQRFLAKILSAESCEILKELGRIRSSRRSKIV